MKLRFMAGLSLTLLLCVVAVNAQTAAEAAPPRQNYKLIWSDEFSGPNGSLPDSSRWVMETGGSGWGNNELETYTKRSVNAHLQDGNLVIVAQREPFTGEDGIQRGFTSARLKTKGKFSQAYGRFEARIKTPEGRGLWPAFWMMGDDVDEMHWPNCGEIDIMEIIGSEPAVVYGSLHGPGYSGKNPLTGTYTLPRGSKFSDGFHVFAVEWDPKEIRFYVDDHLYETRTTRDLPAGTKWVFDHPFFLLLNLAVGGNWPGNPDRSTVFPQKMLVDYVRVYERTR